jgi:hypothetical protein
MPDETLVTPVRADPVAVLQERMKGRRGEGEDINGLRRAGAAPPPPLPARDEALIAIAARIESGVLADLHRTPASEVGARA